MASPSRPLPPLDDLLSAPANPHSGTLPRAALSVRRTSHLNMTWPDGPERDMRIDAAARDLVTGGGGRAQVAASAELRVSVDRTRVLTSLSSVPRDDRLWELIGQGCGRGRGPGCRTGRRGRMGHPGDPRRRLFRDEPWAVLDRRCHRADSM